MTLLAIEQLKTDGGTQSRECGCQNRSVAYTIHRVPESQHISIGDADCG